MNHPNQGSAAEVIKIALVKLFKHEDCFKDFWIVTTVHDEIVLNCINEKVDKVKKILQNTMVDAFKVIFTSGQCVKNLVEVNVGKNWKEAK